MNEEFRPTIFSINLPDSHLVVQRLVESRKVGFIVCAPCDQRDLEDQVFSISEVSISEVNG